MIKRCGDGCFPFCESCSVVIQWRERPGPKYTAFIQFQGYYFYMNVKFHIISIFTRSYEIENLIFWGMGSSNLNQQLDEYLAFYVTHFMTVTCEQTYRWFCLFTLTFYSLEKKQCIKLIKCRVIFTSFNIAKYHILVPYFKMPPFEVI